MRKQVLNYELKVQIQVTVVVPDGNEEKKEKYMEIARNIKQGIAVDPEVLEKYVKAYLKDLLVKGDYFNDKMELHLIQEDLSKYWIDYATDKLTPEDKVYLSRFLVMPLNGTAKTMDATGKFFDELDTMIKDLDVVKVNLKLSKR